MHWVKFECLMFNCDKCYVSSDIPFTKKITCCYSSQLFTTHLLTHVWVGGPCVIIDSTGMDGSTPPSDGLSLSSTITNKSDDNDGLKMKFYGLKTNLHINIKCSGSLLPSHTSGYYIRPSWYLSCPVCVSPLWGWLWRPGGRPRFTLTIPSRVIAIIRNFSTKPRPLSLTAATVRMMTLRVLEEGIQATGTRALLLQPRIHFLAHRPERCKPEGPWKKISILCCLRVRVPSRGESEHISQGWILMFLQKYTRFNCWTDLGRSVGDDVVGSGRKNDRLGCNNWLEQFATYTPPPTSKSWSRHESSYHGNGAEKMQHFFLQCTDWARPGTTTATPTTREWMISNVCIFHFFFRNVFQRFFPRPPAE